MLLATRAAAPRPGPLRLPTPPTSPLSHIHSRRSRRLSSVDWAGGAWRDGAPIGTSYSDSAAAIMSPVAVLPPTSPLSAATVVSGHGGARTWHLAPVAPSYNFQNPPVAAAHEHRLEERRRAQGRLEGHSSLDQLQALYPAMFAATSPSPTHQQCEGGAWSGIRSPTALLSPGGERWSEQPRECRSEVWPLWSRPRLGSLPHTAASGADADYRPASPAVPTAVADAVARINTLLPLQHRMTYHGGADVRIAAGDQVSRPAPARARGATAGCSFSGDCKIWIMVPGHRRLKSRVLDNCRSDDTAGQLMTRMLEQTPYLRQLYRGGAKHFELVEVGADPAVTSPGWRGGARRHDVLDRDASPLNRILGWSEGMVTQAYTLGDPLSDGNGDGTQDPLSRLMTHHAGFVMQVTRRSVSSSRDGQSPSRSSRSGRSATVSGARPSTNVVAAGADSLDGSVRLSRTRSLFSSLSVGGQGRGRSRTKAPSAKDLRKTKSAPH